MSFQLSFEVRKNYNFVKFAKTLIKEGKIWKYNSESTNIKFLI